MKIYGLNKTTLLDYPGKVACTVFTGGCNMRCVFCHNAPLVLNPEGEREIPEEEFFSFLESRAGKLEGVCITGGEPTLQKDLKDFIWRIKSTGDFRVKLDTNGLCPGVLAGLLDEGLPDMIAMDIKGDISSYPRITGIDPSVTERIRESAALIMGSGTEYEFRTTVYGGMLTDTGVEEIGRWLKGAKRFYLQAFEDSGSVMTGGIEAPAPAELYRYRDILKKYMGSVGIRGIADE